MQSEDGHIIDNVIVDCTDREVLSACVFCSNVAQYSARKCSAGANDARTLVAKIVRLQRISISPATSEAA
jgi:hypothetical protein